MTTTGVDTVCMEKNVSDMVFSTEENLKRWKRLNAWSLALSLSSAWCDFDCLFYYLTYVLKLEIFFFKGHIDGRTLELICIILLFFILRYQTMQLRSINLAPIKQQIRKYALQVCAKPLILSFKSMFLRFKLTHCYRACCLTIIRTVIYC